MYYNVKPYEKDRALKRLHDRMEAGEDASNITGIKNQYYLNKVVSGLVNISNIVYARIMGHKPSNEEIPEGGYTLSPKESGFVYRCRECGKLTKRGELLCPECSGITPDDFY